MSEPAIHVENLSKTFKLPHEKTSSIKSALINFAGARRFEVQKALKDVSFEVQKGEFFGIIGRNGSGKSTLLKTLAGIYVPSKGSVQVNGKLTPFIELGVGFNPELTGRENVFLNGALLGFNRKEMWAMYKDIVEFAELERFMDQKLKNYSSGMQVRLAFSIAIRAQSDILLIDEVLAVGDTNFQKKCIAVFEDLKRAGRTIVFVSHAMGDVRNFCDRVAVIDKGDLVFIGATEKGIDVYNKLNLDLEVKESADYGQNKEAEHLGTGGARIISFDIYDKNDRKTDVLKTGDKFTIRLSIEYKSDVQNPVVGVMFRKHPQENLYGINNYYEKISFGKKQKGQRSNLTITDRMPLNPGSYFFTITVSDARSPVDYEELDLLDNVRKVSVTSEKEGWGLVGNAATIKEDSE